MTPKRTKWAAVWLMVAVFGLLAGSADVSLARNKAREIDRILKKYNEYHEFNGVVLVAEGGRPILQKGYGYANFEWKIQNTTDTRFRIGSLTKQFIAAVVLQLIDEGKLGLYDTITDHIPEYPQDQGSRINIHQLLTHSSGIPNYTSLPSFIGGEVRDPHTPEELLSLVAGLDLEFEPGDGFAFSNSNYVVLGVIIERLTGKAIQRVIEERITKPFGLDETGFDNGRVVVNDRAYGYEMNIMEEIPARFMDMTTAYASGGMYSTAKDLFKWDQVLYSDKLFKEPAYKDLMFTPYNQGYGYGWMINQQPIGDTGRKTTVIQHGGGMFGFASTMWRLPEDKNTIIVLDNTSTPSRIMSDIVQDIFNILYDQTVSDPPQPISRAIMPIIDSRGVQAGIKSYHDMKEKSPDAYDFSERELNILGYHYLRDSETETETAIEIFKLNVEAYPDAFNTYDSLGEGYLEAGKLDLAIENYKKSLELNARNENARRILASLGVDPSGHEEIDLPVEVLDRYVGRYEIQTGVVITISRDGDHLVARAGGQPPAVLYAMSETTFFFRVIDAEVSFQIRPDGTAEQLTLHQNGISIPAQRIE